MLKEISLKNRSFLVRLSALVLIAIAFSSPPASNQSGAVIIVNTVEDELIDDGNCSLREAIRAANLDTGIDACLVGNGADIINLPAGTYTLTLLGKNEEAGLMGDLDITAPLTINGTDPASTIVDGNDIDRVFHILNTTMMFSGVTIRHGRLGKGESGAGLHNDGSVMTVSNSIVTGNTDGPDLDCFGGGIMTSNYGSTTVDHSIITDNLAYYGGGIAIWFGDTTIRDSWISNNRSFHWGGGVHQRAGNLFITNSTVNGNQSDTDAGGIQAVAATGIRLTNTTISGNYADVAGGGGSISALVTELNNVTIANNRVGPDNIFVRGGGGLEAYPIQVGNEQIFPIIRNSIIAGNLDQSGHAPDCLGMVLSQGYNLIQSTLGCTISGTVTGNIYGTYPALGLLVNNGGFSPTHALFPGSPGIDAGNPDPPGTSVTSCDVVDQRGMLRPQRVACDMGAYEYVGNIYQTFFPAIHNYH